MAAEFDSDHDLLIRIDVSVRNLGGKLDDFISHTSDQIQRLWETKASKTELLPISGKAERTVTDDHEARIRRLEMWVWRLLGGVAAVDILVHYFFGKK